jgi:hypothetical protein
MKSFLSKFECRKKTLLLLLVGVALCLPRISEAARLYITPASGVFPVGETFSVKVGVDTQGEEINALDLKLFFPADKLQLVSPNTAVSLIDIWASQPKYNNLAGSISLQGGVPNGVTTSGALITELTFRVRSTGQAMLTFSNESAIFLNDGRATPVKVDYQNSLINLVLPPPEGPLVTSGTHQEGEWSRSTDAAFEWLNTDSEGYSFILDQNPVTIPDNTVDSLETGAFYRGISEGVNFFHIKSLRAGVWGGSSHFEVKVDSKPPASFDIEVFPSARTSATQPTFVFATSDAHSALSHYELNIIPLFRDDGGSQTSFIEVTSPFISHQLEPGPYEVIVKAYDNAGNSVEVAKRFRVTKGSFLSIQKEGFVLVDVLTVSWGWLLVTLSLLVFLIIREVLLTKKSHSLVHKEKRNTKRGDKDLPREIKTELSELEKYRKKYGHLTLFLVATSMLLGGPLTVSAQQSPIDSSSKEELVSAPIITSWSEYVTNNEIFYVKGSADTHAQEIILYLQDLHDGTLSSYQVPIEGGEWLYRHERFLSPGEYAIWTQSSSGSLVSPPGAQYNLIVEREAVSFGASHVSLATIYVVIIVILGLLLLILWGVMRRRRFYARRRYLDYLREAEEAERAVKGGFELLHKKLVSHLDDLRKKTEEGVINPRDVIIEEAEILLDVEKIENRIKQEVADIEQVLQRHNEKTQGENKG